MGKPDTTSGQTPEARVQGENQGSCWCEVAAVRRLGESVVVSKARPEKPSNGVEEKTELTISIASDGAPLCQKQASVAKGGSTL
ncbi:hypothetical protein CIK04_03005 [Vibrio sp. 03_296]|nr:hypothetical protein CIK04_30375 [Vibrio sp. 03_296]OZT86261.1 hypothetical protein CIK04_03005 [Vibrio sp. 03_296]